MTKTGCLAPRRRFMKMTAAFGYAAGLPSLAMAEVQPARLPLEHFARRPLMEEASISPDGKRLAVIINSGEDSVLVTRPVDGPGAISTLLSTNNLERQINWIAWVNNERLLISLRFAAEREMAFNESFETMETRLFAVNHDGSQMINLVKAVNEQQKKQLSLVSQQDLVIDMLKEDGQHILMMLPEAQHGLLAVFKVNVYTADRNHFSDSRRMINSWTTDQQARVRIGSGWDAGTGEEFTIACDPDGKSWREVARSKVFDAAPLKVLGFGKNPNKLFVRKQHEERDAVFTLDIASVGAEPELFFSDPQHHLNGSLVYSAEGEPVGVRYALNGRGYRRYWDPHYKAMMDQIQEGLPKLINTIVSTSRDGRRHIVYSYSPTEPGTYALAAFDDEPGFVLLGRTFPELRGKAISVKRPIEYLARDGLKIHGYLSLPPGVTEGKNLPMVLFPHGGPQAADDPNFDSWVAFMADRGCAVLQVNFRGSIGYGGEFMKKGLRRWGLEMQDDLTDAVQEFVKRGIADPARIVAVGASYGGYAALMGLVKTPELFQGAFAFAPVTDLVEMTKEQIRYRHGYRKVVKAQVGDPDEDRQQLIDTSPNLHVSRIKRPVVLVHGTQDRQAEYQHSVLMAKALAAAGKPHKLITQRLGDHQASHLPYRLQLFRELQAFLDERLQLKSD